MATDTKNIIRVDLQEIYNECIARSEFLCKAENIDPDIFVIKSTAIKMIHSFAMEGAALISDNAGMVKDSCQTGINALTYDDDLDNPDPVPVNEFDKPIEQMGEQADVGEKLEKSIMDFALFNIEDLSTEQNRYTVVQNFIKSALIHYICYKWWTMMNRKDLAASDFGEFTEFNGKVRFNSVRNHKRKNIVRPYSMY